jgi:exonuclease III
MHWNAEGVYNKKTELQHFLHERDINVCCIQETHLQPAKSFKVRGYQCFRSDRVGRKKGGILTLVRNNINDFQTKTHTDDSEFQVLSLRKNEFSLTLVNFYSPQDKNLSLHTDSIPTDDTNFIIVGDFNSHSQSWGDMTALIIEEMKWKPGKMIRS